MKLEFIWRFCFEPKRMHKTEFICCLKFEMQDLDFALFNRAIPLLTCKLKFWKILIFNFYLFILMKIFVFEFYSNGACFQWAQQAGKTLCIWFSESSMEIKFDRVPLRQEVKFKRKGRRSRKERQNKTQLVNIWISFRPMDNQR